jgi:transcriptional regulator with XRE-family HTH domain
MVLPTRLLPIRRAAAMAELRGDVEGLDDLASRAGTTRQSVYRLLKGEAVSARTLRGVIGVLGLTVDQVVIAAEAAPTRESEVAARLLEPADDDAPWPAPPWECSYLSDGP